LIIRLILESTIRLQSGGQPKTFHVAAGPSAPETKSIIREETMIAIKNAASLSSEKTKKVMEEIRSSGDAKIQPYTREKLIERNRIFEEHFELSREEMYAKDPKEEIKSESEAENVSSKGRFI
jgi:sRNA-binding carbon storage regulator CsrA